MTLRTATLAVLLPLCCLGLAACRGREQTASGGDIGQKGKDFVSLLADRKFDEATSWFDPTMAAAMPAGKLEQAWDSLSPLGTYRSQSGVRTANEQGYEAVYVTCEFEKGTITVKVVFDGSGKVGGLWFV